MNYTNCTLNIYYKLPMKSCRCSPYRVSPSHASLSLSTLFVACLLCYFVPCGLQRVVKTFQLATFAYRQTGVIAMLSIRRVAQNLSPITTTTTTDTPTHTLPAHPVKERSKQPQLPLLVE